MSSSDAKQQPKKGGGGGKEKGGGGGSPAPPVAADASGADEAAGGAKSKAQLRAERRMIQEAQRAAKAAGKPPPQQQQKPAPSSGEGVKAESKKGKQQQQQLQNPPASGGKGSTKDAKNEKQQKLQGEGEGSKSETKQENPHQPKPPSGLSEVGSKPVLEAKKQPVDAGAKTKKLADTKNQGRGQKAQAQTKPLPADTKQQQQAGAGKRKATAVGPPLPSFFRHLTALTDADQLTNGLYNEQFAKSHVEVAFVQLALMVAHERLQGPSARCLGLARALRELLGDVQAQDLPRLLKYKLDPNMQLLRSAKPLTVMESYLEQCLVNWVQEGSSDSSSENFLLDRLKKFVEDQIDKARSTIIANLTSKINKGDTVMLYKPSSLIFESLEKIAPKLADGSIILLDSPPNWEAQAFLGRLRAHPQLSACSVRYALLSAAPSLLSDTSKVVLEGHALTANGNVLAPVGTAYLANVAWSQRIPCLVLCNACQTWDKVLIDSVSYNELGRVSGDSQLCNIQYDLTPGDLVTALITDRGILPCTGSPVLPH